MLLRDGLRLSAESQAYGHTLILTKTQTQTNITDGYPRKMCSKTSQQQEYGLIQRQLTPPLLLPILPPAIIDFKAVF